MSKTMTACGKGPGGTTTSFVKTGFEKINLAQPASLYFLVAALLLMFFVPPQARAIGLASAEQAVGQWDLSLADSNRKCRLSLRAETAGSGYVLGMPAGCRRSLPILAGVNSWAVPISGRLDLADSSGAPVLDFAAADDGGLLASGPQGETYRLAAVTAAGHGVQAVSPAAPQTPGFEPVQPGAPLRRQKTTVFAARPGDIAGRYYILREGGKDTGCMLTLDDHSQGVGGNRASLAPACRDEGMVIFDPAGWQVVAGRLVLTARKGHTTHLDHQEDGNWAKDPHEGKMLILKKM
jgi:Protease inhibitor Inh